MDRVTARAWAALVVAEAEPALSGRRNAAAVLAVLAADFETAPAGRARTSQVNTGADATIDVGASRRPRDVPDTAVANAAGLLSDEFQPDPPPVRAGAEQILDPAGLDSAATDAIATDRDGTGRDNVSSDDADRDDAGRDGTDGIDRDYDTGREPAGWNDADRDGSGADDVGEGKAGRLPTAWAGLLFLLATAARAGVPDDLLADDALAGHPLSWALYHVGRLLVPAEPDDPALFALAGVAPQPVSLPPEPAAVPGAAEALARQAARWAAGHRRTPGCRR